MQVLFDSIINEHDWQQITFGLTITPGSGRQEIDIHPLMAAIETLQSSIGRSRISPSKPMQSDAGKAGAADAQHYGEPSGNQVK